MASRGRGEPNPTRRFGVLPRGLAGWLVGLLALAGALASVPVSGIQGLSSSAPFKVSAAMAHPGCLSSCHTTHSITRLKQEQAGKTKSTVGRLAPLDIICLSCHQGPRIKEDLGAAKLPDGTNAASRHVFDLTRMKHLPYARQLDKGQARAIGRKQVVLRSDCSGCHDVHGKELGPMLAPVAFDNQGTLTGVKPLFAAQVCYGCHAGSEAAPLADGNSDVGHLFARGVASSHWIGRSAADRHDLPSLRGGDRVKLDCTSCHGNPEPTGTPGPHYSSYPHLLKAAYAKEKDWPQAGASWDNVCYLCHDQHSIEADDSFPLHLEHITGFVRTTGKAAALGRGATAFPSGIPMSNLARLGRPTPVKMGFGQPTTCATCHNPHGSAKNAHLIEFDPTVVFPSSVGGISYVRLGLGRGTCTLSCHGHDHVQTSY